MSKQKDQKRKAQLSEKAKNESFKFQVEYARQQRGTFIAADAPELTGWWMPCWHFATLWMVCAESSESSRRTSAVR